MSPSPRVPWGGDGGRLTVPKGLGTPAPPQGVPAYYAETQYAAGARYVRHFFQVFTTFSVIKFVGLFELTFKELLNNIHATP